MITRYRIINPGDTVRQAFSKEREVEMDWPRKPGYRLINELVAPLLGGKSHMMEHVSVWEDFSDGEKFEALDMFVDELGLQNGLPRNEVATAAYRRANQLGLTAAPKVSDMEQLNFIVGPAILFSRRVWF